jgi:CO dehydrogenase maturation factor
LIDLAAGVEFLGRASVQGIDALVIVVEPSGRSIETANNMAKMAVDLGIKNVVAIGNKISDTIEIETIKSQLKDITLLGTVSYSKSIQQADLKRTPVIQADEEFMRQLREVKGALIDLISAGIATKDSA